MAFRQPGYLRRYRTGYQESATEKDEIDPAVEYGNEIQEISGLTAGQTPPTPASSAASPTPAAIRSIVRYAAAVTRRVHIADEKIRQRGGRRPVENLGRRPSLMAEVKGSSKVQCELISLQDCPDFTRPLPILAGS